MIKTQVVKAIYRDFMAGNAAAILAAFDDEIEFRLAEGHPYRGGEAPWVGKDAVARRFLAVAAPEWIDWSITVLDSIETADAVVVEGRYTGVYKSNGNAMDVQVCHVWRFRAGKIASFHQYLDTARLQRVMGRKPDGY